MGWDNDILAQAVRVTALSSHSATVVRVAYGPFVAVGSAKLEPGDAYDPDTGLLLATSRALEVLAGRLRRQANGRVRNAEAIRSHRAEVAKRKADPQELARRRLLKQAPAPKGKKGC